jgi:lysophospholipase L1-like esterase
MASKTPFRILCLGDSLTDGYPAAHPYAGKLVEGLEAAFPSYDVQVEVDGRPGDQVAQGTFVRRMQRQWAQNTKGFDWTIVLGGTKWASAPFFYFPGTPCLVPLFVLWKAGLGEVDVGPELTDHGSDIAWGYQANVVFEALKQTWDIPLSKGGRVLALTIPECEGNYLKSNTTRGQINKAIKAHKHDKLWVSYSYKIYKLYFQGCQASNSTFPASYTFDLFEKMPFHDMVSTDREKYWDLDGLHLTEDGYDFMGERIAEGLIKILHLQEAQTTEISNIFTDARQRRLIEDMIFDEEAGDPKRLSQGYIIVRKKDLD